MKKSFYKDMEIMNNEKSTEEEFIDRVQSLKFLIRELIADEADPRVWLSVLVEGIIGMSELFQNPEEIRLKAIETISRAIPEKIS